MQDKPKALAVARYLLKAVREDDRRIGRTSLIKLTYIAHGLTLAVKNESLIGDEPVYAWKYGPVIKSIFDRFVGFKNHVIQEDYIDPEEEDTLTEDEKKIIEFTVTKYRDLTGIDLSELTHQKGSPWGDVYEELHENGRLKPNGDIPNDFKIPNQLIANYYIDLIEDRGWDVIGSK